MATIQIISHFFHKSQVEQAGQESKAVALYAYGVLFKEASLVKLQIRMLRDGNVRQYCSTKYQVTAADRENLGGDAG